MPAPASSGAYNPYYEPIFEKALREQVRIPLSTELKAKNMQRNMNYWRATKRKELKAATECGKHGLKTAPDTLARMEEALRGFEMIVVRVEGTTQGVWEVVLESRFDAEETLILEKILASASAGTSATDKIEVMEALAEAPNPMDVLNKTLPKNNVEPDK